MVECDVSICGHDMYHLRASQVLLIYFYLINRNHILLRIIFYAALKEGILFRIFNILKRCCIWWHGSPTPSPFTVKKRADTQSQASMLSHVGLKGKLPVSSCSILLPIFVTMSIRVHWIFRPCFENLCIIH